PLRELLLDQKKVTKEKSLELNFNLAKHRSGKELTTFEHRAHRPDTEPKLRRFAASYSLSAGNRPLDNVAHPEALAVVDQDLDRRARAVAEDEQRAAEGVGLQALPARAH